MAKSDAYELWRLDEHRWAVARDGLVIWAGSQAECERRIEIHEREAADRAERLQKIGRTE